MCSISKLRGENHKRGPRVTSLTRETVRNNKHIFANAPFWLKLDKWFWRRLLNFVNVFLLFCYYLPLERAWPFIWTNLNSLHKDSLCHIWLKLVQWFWRRRWKCEKFTDVQTDRPMDRRTTVTGYQKSSLELSAQVS